MRSSGADIVRSYMEKYTVINRIKTGKSEYDDPLLARYILSVAYHIIHTMQYLHFSNNANDFDFIKKYIRQQVGLVHQEIKKKQSFFERTYRKSVLPPDFKQCISEAWFRLQYLEKKYKEGEVKELLKPFPRP